MMNRAAAAIVHRYPGPWRERYEAEVLALIEDSPVRFSDLGELVRGLIVERARALIEDADHPRRTAAILGSVHLVFVALLAVWAWSAGVLLRRAYPLPTPLEFIGPSVKLLWLITFWPVALRRLLGRSTGPGALESPVFSPRTGLALLPVAFLIMVLVEWTYVPRSSAVLISPAFDYWMSVWMNVWFQGISAGILTASLMPRRRLLQALTQVALLDERIASAQTWVDGCRTMIGLGIASPEEVAQAAADRLRRERDDVMAQLQSLGYRARFRQ
jgi:hypothetical protein